MIRRINLWGGPSAGKSRTAARLFADLKDWKSQTHSPYEIELVREYIKDWAWEGKAVKGWDQLHIFSEQLRREEMLLRNNVDIIITDCPIGLNTFYAVHNNLPFAVDLAHLASKYEKEYPSINLVLQRPEVYHEKGRYHNKTEACQIDIAIKEFLGLDQFTVVEDPVYLKDYVLGLLI